MKIYIDKNLRPGERIYMRESDWELGRYTVELKADPKRSRHADRTGIYVRAVRGKENKPDSVDIAELDRASLLTWLRKDGGENKLAENVVGRLLGHAENIA